MIKLFKVKEKQRELAENASNGIPVKKQSAGELRLHKGFFLIKLFIFCVFHFHPVKFVWHLPFTPKKLKRDSQSKNL
jgi:hypothetical protein